MKCHVSSSHQEEVNDNGKYLFISLYYKKISPPPPFQESRGGEGGRGPGGRIILSPPKARNFLVCSKFGFVRSLDLFELRVCAKFGFVRLHRPGVLAGRGARSPPRSASLFIYFLNFLTFFIQFRFHVIKFHFIRVLLQKKFSNSIIDIQCNAGVLSAIIKFV